MFIIEIIFFFELLIFTFAAENGASCYHNVVYDLRRCDSVHYNSSSCRFNFMFYLRLFYSKNEGQKICSVQKHANSFNVVSLFSSLNTKIKMADLL